MFCDTFDFNKVPDAKPGQKVYVVNWHSSEGGFNRESGLLGIYSSSDAAALAADDYLDPSEPDDYATWEVQYIK